MRRPATVLEVLLLQSLPHELFNPSLFHELEALGSLGIFLGVRTACVVRTWQLLRSCFTVGLVWQAS